MHTKAAFKVERRELSTWGVHAQREHCGRGRSTEGMQVLAVAMELQSNILASGHGTVNLVLCIVSLGLATWEGVTRVQVPPWPVSASACLVAFCRRQITSGLGGKAPFTCVWPGGGMPACTV